VSRKDLNPVNRCRPKRAAIVISNSAVSTTAGQQNFSGGEVADVIVEAVGR
jgi:hypothetical protein